MTTVIVPADEAATRRATYLLQSDVALLKQWGAAVRVMFFGEVPYLVGSALTSADYRDVDVRVILDDPDHAALAGILKVSSLNVAVSLWGQKATGLPIDFQVQQMTEANRDFNGRRHPIDGAP